MPHEPTPERDATGALASDIGRRAADWVNLHVSLGLAGRWVALRLHDGGSDGQTYDSRPDAIEHQLHEQYCCYLRLTPDGISPDDAYRYIRLNRALYDAGYRLADPEMPGEPIYPHTVEAAERYIERLRHAE